MFIVSVQQWILVHILSKFYFLRKFQYSVTLATFQAEHGTETLERSANDLFFTSQCLDSLRPPTCTYQTLALLLSNSPCSLVGMICATWTYSTVLCSYFDLNTISCRRRARVRVCRWTMSQSQWRQVSTKNNESRSQSSRCSSQGLSRLGCIVEWFYDTQDVFTRFITHSLLLL